MCGIFGGYSNNLPEGYSSKAINLLKHRGPDGSGFVQKGNYFLGHTRLAIQDVSELGAQPMHSSCGKAIITFNGEIYNVSELREDLISKGFVLNGNSDTVGGVICADEEFIGSMIDVNSGSSMLLGPVMDSMRAASILKNLRTLHLRMKKHSENAMYLSKKFKKDGLRVIYPGLEEHPQHELMKHQMNDGFGFGGMFVIDAKTNEKANQLMEEMQNSNLGYLAVSLGFYKTLFSAPGLSTSSEIPEDERDKMGLSDGLVRISIGLDNDIERTYSTMIKCMKNVEIL